MKYIGAHVSAAGGVENAPLNAQKIGAKSFALFTKNQRQWNAKPLTDKNINEFKENLFKADIKPEHVLPHDSYLINLGSPKLEMRKKSFAAFLDEAKRVEQLGLIYLNFHPGSHLKEISEEHCIELIAGNINDVISQTNSVILVIENTAGQGSNIGYKFEHLRDIITLIKNKSRVGVCLDTCHTFTAGYDLRTQEAFDESMRLFDEIVGFKYLKGMHLNDSKVDYSSKKDRHENLGKGLIGIDAFQFFMKDTRFDNIPLILETPNDELWEKEIKMLYNMI